MIKSIFKYIEPIWLGKDRKPSLRRLLALVYTLGFIIEVNKDSTKPEVLMIIASMVAALLSLTTFQNISMQNKDINNSQEGKADE